MKNDGNILKVVFDEPYFTYAKVISLCVMKIYNLRLVKKLEPLEVLNNTDKLFTVYVFRDSFKRWKKIGKLPLTEEEQTPPKFCKKELGEEVYSISQENNYFPCSKDECVKYEPLMVWEAESIEERIRDHFADRKNEGIEYYWNKY